MSSSSAEGHDRRLNLDCRPRRPHGVVLMADGDPERCHDRVSGELLDRSSMPRDGRRDGVEVPTHHAVQRLRIELLGERRRVGDVREEDRRQLPLLRWRDLAGGRGGRCGRSKRVVLPQDGSLEVAQLRAGLDTDLLDEHPAGRLVGGESVGLSAAAIEGDHQLATGPFPQRLGSDERLELAHGLRVMTKGQLRLDPILECAEPELIELRDVCLYEGLVGEVGHGRATPEGQSFPERE
jgi:hypothetical protein